MTEKLSKNALKSANKRKKSGENHQNHDRTSNNNHNHHHNDKNYHNDNDRTRPESNQSINYSSNQSIKSISMVFLILTAIGICLVSILIPYRLFLNPNLHKGGAGTTPTTVSTNGGITTATESGATTATATTGVAAIDFFLQTSINYAKLMKRLAKKLDANKFASFIYSLYIRYFQRKIFNIDFWRQTDTNRQNGKSRQNGKNPSYDRLAAEDEAEEETNCYKTCKIEIVESIPENITLSLMTNDTIDSDDMDKNDDESSIIDESSASTLSSLSSSADNNGSTLFSPPPSASKKFYQKNLDEKSSSSSLSISTFDAWKQLLSLARQNLDIAAYKSSLRGKHVVDSMVSPSTAWGEEIFERLLTLNRDHKVQIRMVENYPPRDRGDNEDGISLEKRGVIDRRPLYYSKIFGTPGAMHSKFLLADSLHFYLGSANFDWRSLNQKLEIGVLVLDCPCLAKDLRSIFNTYWSLTKLFNVTAGANKAQTMDKDRSKQIWQIANAVPTRINMHRPLRILHMGVPTSVYLAASPMQINGDGRTRDLDAILDVINNARDFIYINVMDYVPMFIYREPKRYWPIIDDAIRKAVVERRIELKIICAALHYVPENLFFLKSLQALNGITEKYGRGGVEIKIFHVPAMTEFQSIIARDRRTHRKFMVTEDTVVIGTSNWSGDYFTGSTGVQVVIKQNSTTTTTTMENLGPFIRKIRKIFERDWTSAYAHDLTLYMQICLATGQQTDLHITGNQKNYDERSRRMCAPVRK